MEVECQKDLKQIRADKDFHKSTILQISSVFGLTKKAVTCTSDVEMVLTALQCIHQLKQLKGTEWESDAFIHLLSTQAKFRNNLKQDIRKIGIVNRLHEGKSIILPIPQSVELGQILTFNIKNNKALLDFRSGEQVKLQGTKSREIGVSITYGQSKKALDTRKITITENPDGISEVAVRLVCGGIHTITITIGDKPVEGNPFVVNVEGVPKVGDRVTKGPDWNPDTPPNIGGGLSSLGCAPGRNMGVFGSTPDRNMGLFAIGSTGGGQFGSTGGGQFGSTGGGQFGSTGGRLFGSTPGGQFVSSGGGVFGSTGGGLFGSTAGGLYSQCRPTLGANVTVLPSISVQGQSTQMEA